MLRPATSVGAHYREAVRARSKAEFISKIEGGLQEPEETMCGMELLAKSNMIDGSFLDELYGEADQGTAILVTCVQNTKQRIGK